MKDHIQEDPNKREKKMDWHINEVYPNGCHQYERASHAEKYI